jgi:hypothetical protein
VEIGRLAELIERLATDGVGVTVMPVREGTPMGGFGTQHFYKFDGWEVGYMTPGSGGELAVGRTIAEAVDAALATYDAADE